MASKFSSTWSRVTRIRASSWALRRAILVSSPGLGAPVSGFLRKRVQRRCRVSPRPIRPTVSAWRARCRSTSAGPASVSPSRKSRMSPEAASAPALEAAERPLAAECRTATSRKLPAAWARTAWVSSLDPSSTTTTSAAAVWRVSEARVSRSRSASSLVRMTTLRLTARPGRPGTGRDPRARAPPRRRRAGSLRRSDAMRPVSNDRPRPERERRRHQ